MPELNLDEWEQADPTTSSVLQGRTLDRFEDRAAATRLRFAVRIDEGRDGLHIRAKQHVGVVQLGDLRIRIRPKLPLATLWPLVAYGLGLDRIAKHPPVDFALTGDMPELLAAMLLAESDALQREGLARGYRPKNEWLATPRGRFDMAELARNLPLSRAELPCIHHPYSSNILCNQVVAAGLQLAMRYVRTPRLRSGLHAAGAQWRMQCQLPLLTPALLDAADRNRSRLLTRYAPAHALVRAIVDQAGPADDLRAGPQRVAGAFFNMATVFERAVARFLEEHLGSRWSVDTQHRLRQLYSVQAGSHTHRATVPRPDLVVRAGTRAVAVLDTKYRDLSDHNLPPTMLYQMSVYSLAFGGTEPIPAIVLYAVPSGNRKDVHIRLHVEHGVDRDIVLRAVPLDHLVAMAGTAKADAEALRWVGLQPAVSPPALRHGATQ